jgi:hypothetical protein
MKNMWGIPSKDREQKRKDIREKLNKDAKTKKNVVDSSLPSSLRLATTSTDKTKIRTNDKARSDKSKQDLNIKIKDLLSDESVKNIIDTSVSKEDAFELSASFVSYILTACLCMIYSYKSSPPKFLDQSGFRELLEYYLSEFLVILIFALLITTPIHLLSKSKFSKTLLMTTLILLLLQTIK